MDRFLNYWRSSGQQRVGLLIGQYEQHPDIPLGIRATVSAIYEPPQVSLSSALLWTFTGNIHLGYLLFPMWGLYSFTFFTYDVLTLWPCYLLCETARSGTIPRITPALAVCSYLIHLIKQTFREMLESKLLIFCLLKGIEVAFLEILFSPSESLYK